MVSQKDMKWLRSIENRRPPTSDVSEPMITVTDVKHYFYCPRIIYFEHVLHAKPQLGSQQEDSRKQHEEYVRKELRRMDAIYYSSDFVGAEKMLFVPLCSSKIGLKGTVDLIIKTRSGECIPVDYKNMTSNNGRVWIDHKYQLAAYALLIDEAFNTTVKRGFINYIPEKLIVKLEITRTVKMHVKRALGHIKRIIQEEKLLPIRVSRKKCTGGCGHKQICQQL